MGLFRQFPFGPVEAIRLAFGTALWRETADELPRQARMLVDVQRRTLVPLDLAAKMLSAQRGSMTRYA